MGEAEHRSVERSARVAVGALRIVAFVGLLGMARAGYAERLPIQVFTAMDGLGSNNIGCVLRDSRGFMWFCTTDGLTRFDGSSFITYGAEEGLPHPSVNDLLEHPAGVYWLATNGGGVARFDATTRTSTEGEHTSSRMTVYPVGATAPSNRVNVVQRDRVGRIWAGTDSGLFRLDEPLATGEFHAIDVGPHGGLGVRDLLEDRYGQVWIAATEGLFSILADGRVIEYAQRVPGASLNVSTFLADRGGRLWIGSASGLTVVTPAAHGCEQDVAGESPIVATAAPCRSRAFPGEPVRALHQHGDGRLWVARETRLEEIEGERARTYAQPDGPIEDPPRALGEDGAGNLWIGTDNRLVRIARHGFVSYGRIDGLDAPRAHAFFETNRGELCLVLDGSTRIARFENGRFEIVPVNVPRAGPSMWGWAQTALQDRQGEWWIPSGHGLYRFPAGGVRTLRHSRPRAVYKKEDGLPDDQIFRLYEDSRGDIWIGTIGAAPDRLARWERSTGRFHRYTSADGLRPRSAPTAFVEDHAGNLWIGFYNGGVARYRDGRLTLFAEETGVPRGGVRAMLLDRTGRLWVATSAGRLARLDQPNVSAPRFEAVARRDRLASRAVYSLVDDEWGRLYIGTARGIERLDPHTGELRRYTVADGLADVAVLLAFRDQHGDLWFGTRRGVSRIRPQRDERDEPHHVFIGRVDVDGVPVPLSQLGQRTVRVPTVNPGRNHIHIGFFGLAFGAGKTLRYQYRLEGADERWSSPTEERGVTYAGLAPGDYRFTVRLAPELGRDASSASVAFRILPPIWLRWWFLTLSAVAGGALVVVVHRARVSRLVELERVRVRIATDLHDDIGSNLSKIALLSGMTARQVAPRAPEAAARLSSIADISQESVDAMSDIVWAVDPTRDHLQDLVQRLRRFASDVLTARGVDLRFIAPVGDEALPLGADVRREVFLICKEAVNNLARYAACTTAEIELRHAAGHLVLRVQDNGQGFVPEAAHEGNGLASMRRRAHSLGGELQIVSSSNPGTRITLRVPLKATLRRAPHRSRRREAF